MDKEKYKNNLEEQITDMAKTFATSYPYDSNYNYSYSKAQYSNSVSAPLKDEWESCWVGTTSQEFQRIRETALIACKNVLKSLDEDQSIKNINKLMHLFIETANQLLCIPYKTAYFKSSYIMRFKTLFIQFYNAIHLKKRIYNLIKENDLCLIEDIDELKLMIEDYCYLIDDMLEKSDLVRATSKNIINKLNKIDCVDNV